MEVIIENIEVNLIWSSVSSEKLTLTVKKIAVFNTEDILFNGNFHYELKNSFKENNEAFLDSTTIWQNGEFPIYTNEFKYLIQDKHDLIRTWNHFKTKQLKIGVLDLRLFDPAIHDVIILEAINTSESDKFED